MHEESGRLGLCARRSAGASFAAWSSLYPAVPVAAALTRTPATTSVTATSVDHTDRMDLR